MTFARLVVRDLFRNRLRLVLTVAAGAIGVLAFIFLQTVVDLFYLGTEGARADRLVVRNKAGFTQPLPLAYGDRIAAVPGVTAVTHQSWFGGKVGDSPRDQFANFYVDAATFTDVYDEYLAPPEQAAAWRQDPCGVMVGEQLARQRGWKVGDRVVLEGSIFPGEWPLTIRGIYSGANPNVDTTAFVFGYRCVNERAPADLRDRVGIYGVRVDDPSRSPQVAAEIDALFDNSPYETRSESERAFQQSFLAMTSAILVAIQSVSLVILLIVLLVVANTLLMGTREKTVDLATLKAIGFRTRHVLALVVWEALLIGALAGGLGIALAPSLLRGFVKMVETNFGAMPEIHLQPGTLAMAALASTVVSLFAALVPAWRAARLPVAEALRRVA